MIHKGPFEDTEVVWFECAGRPGFRATLNGYPRQIIGDSRADLGRVIKEMKRGDY